MNTDRQSVENVLKDKGYIIISTAGYSMAPMLRDRKDTVEIHRPTEIPKKYDVVLFRKGNKLVLHRIIKVTKDGYITRGDNTVEKDVVGNDDIIGVLYAFTRHGKRHAVTDISYRFYARYIVSVHPMKIYMQRVLRKLKR